MKTVIITGASRGIGLATAKKFLAESWFVIGTSTSGKVNIENDNLKVIKLDYLDSDSIVKASKQIQKLGRKIDVLINNAGHGDFENSELVNIDLLKQTIQVNVIGTADFTNRLVPLLASPSHVVNVSSRSASFLHPEDNPWHTPSYRISKAALNMFTISIAKPLKERGIVISSIDPGWVKTDMGGEDADREPEEAAEDIYKLAIADIETGKFWLNGQKRDW